MTEYYFEIVLNGGIGGGVRKNGPIVVDKEKKVY